MIFKHEPGVAHGLRASNSRPKTTSGYRIQFREQETNSWRVYANFQFYGEAEACLTQLLLRGIEAKLDSDSCRQAI